MAVSSGAERVHVLCGSLCVRKIFISSPSAVLTDGITQTGTWDWSGLSTSGGKTGSSSTSTVCLVNQLSITSIFRLQCNHWVHNVSVMFNALCKYLVCYGYTPFNINKRSTLGEIPH